MTVTLGRVKKGTDYTFRTIDVSVGGSPQDLTEEGWTVSCEFRPNEFSDVAVEPNIAEGPLEDSEVVLSLSAEQTAAMAAQVWKGDVKVEGPTGISKSETFDIIVVAAVTQP